MFKTLYISICIIIVSFNVNGQTTVPDLVLYEYEADSGVAISNHGNKVVLIFTSSNCPYVNSYNNRINKLAKSNKNYKFIIVNVGTRDKNQYNNSIVVNDEKMKIAKACGITRTPEVLVLNGLKVMYKGAIDDNPLVEHDVRNHYLQDALNNLSNGIKPKTNHKSFGCIVRH